MDVLLKANQWKINKLHEIVGRRAYKLLYPLKIYKLKIILLQFIIEMGNHYWSEYIKLNIIFAEEILANY